MSEGVGYLLLFGVLSSPFVFWCYEKIRKSCKKEMDEFEKDQAKQDYWCNL